jgi:hypothetical protein
MGLLGFAQRLPGFFSQSHLDEMYSLAYSVPWVILRLICRSASILAGVFCFRRFAFTVQTTLSLAFATFARRVKPKSFVCHSYGKHRGWAYPYEQDPVALCASMQKRPQPQCVHAFTHDSLDTPPPGYPCRPDFPKPSRLGKRAAASSSRSPIACSSLTRMLAADEFSQVARSQFPPTPAILR